LTLYADHVVLLRTLYMLYSTTDYYLLNSVITFVPGTYLYSLKLLTFNFELTQNSNGFVWLFFILLYN